jgi:hypothetical protein
MAVQEASRCRWHRGGDASRRLIDLHGAAAESDWLNSNLMRR